MKYGINTLAWTIRLDTSFEPTFIRIREWGFDGVELFVSPESLPAFSPSSRSSTGPISSAQPAACCPVRQIW